MKTTSVFIGGKQIGVACLRQLLKCRIMPRLVIPNLDDMGSDTWHESLIKVARAAGLSVLTGKKVKDPDVVRRLQRIKPDILFCIGGTQLIPSEVLEAPRLGCLNIHPALLPKYRGRYSTVHAIFNGERFTGVTVHWMDEGIDSGPIIMQKRFRITDDDTAKTVYDKFTAVGEKLFASFLRLWLSGKRIPSKPQEERGATYYSKGLPNNGQIDWSWSGKKIYNFVRSMTFEPFPPAEFSIGGKTMVIIDKKYFRGFKKKS